MKDVFDYSYNESRMLYKNDFETGLNGWEPHSPEKGHFDFYNYKVNVEITDEEAHSGGKCMKISGRKRSWNGAKLNITDYIKTGVRDYEAMVWVKLREDAAPCRVHLSLEYIAVIGGVEFPEYLYWDDYSPSRSILSKYRLPVGTASLEPTGWDIKYPPGYTTKDGWALLRGKINLIKGDFDYIYAYIETGNAHGEKGPGGSDYGGTNTNDIYVDDFTLLSGS